MNFLKNVIYLVTGTIVSLSVQAQIVNFDLTQIQNAAAQTLYETGISATFTAVHSWNSEGDTDSFPYFNANSGGLVILQNTRTNDDQMTISFSRDVKLVGFTVFTPLPDLNGKYISAGFENSNAKIRFTIGGTDYDTGDNIAIYGPGTFNATLSNVIVSAGTDITLTSIVDPNVGAEVTWSNIRVEIVPEPSAYALILGGGYSFCLEKGVPDAQNALNLII